MIQSYLPRQLDADETQATIDKIETFLSQQEEPAFWTTYVGTGAPRFILAMDVPTPGPFMGQIVIQTDSLDERDALKEKLREMAGRELVGTDVFVKNLEIGPPVGKPVQYRVTSSDMDEARDAARGLAAVLAREPRLRDISLDWNEPARVVRVVVGVLPAVGLAWLLYAFGLFSMGPVVVAFIAALLLMAVLSTMVTIPVVAPRLKRMKTLTERDA